MQQIGFFGGTFDPPHFGHIHLALSLMEAHHLQEIWFCPAAANPSKQPKTAAYHRLAMTALAIETIPSFYLLEYEALKPPPSYTVETLRYLYTEEKKRAVSRNIRLLMGEDTAAHLSRWRSPEEVIRIAPPLIGSRTAREGREGTDSISLAVQKGYTNIPLLDISSSKIRERLHLGLFCSHLLPAKVVDYIYEHQLYFCN